MKLKIAICDDEHCQQELLSRQVRVWAEQCRSLVQIETFSDARALLFAYEEQQDYDILLLDIEMDGMSGVELARKIRTGTVLSVRDIPCERGERLQKPLAFLLWGVW